MELSKMNATEQRSLRETLRWATREEHARLDAHFDAIVDPARHEVYDLFIRMNHACHEDLLPVLAASPLAPHYPAPDGRLAALRRDMVALELAPLALPPFPVCAPDLQEAAGIAYVLEGSRLGSTLILRRLDAATPGGRFERSSHYLSISAHAAPFRSLMEALGALAWDDPSLERASAAAAATFDHFARAANLAGARA